MCMADNWEVSDPSDAGALWRLMVGHEREDMPASIAQAGVILDGIPHGIQCLEVGAGIGRLMNAVHASCRFVQVAGVDSSITMTLASERYLQGTGMKVELTDGLRLPYPDTTFDFVYSFTVYQHMMSLAMVHRNLMETRRVLKPGGLCRIQTIASGADRDPRDLTLFDGRVFRDGEEFADRFRAAAMEVVAVEAGLTHPEHVWVTARRGG